MLSEINVVVLSLNNAIPNKQAIMIIAIIVRHIQYTVHKESLFVQTYNLYMYVHCSRIVFLLFFSIGEASCYLFLLKNKLIIELAFKLLSANC